VEIGNLSFEITAIKIQHILNYYSVIKGLTHLLRKLGDVYTVKRITNSRFYTLYLHQVLIPCIIENSYPIYGHGWDKSLP